MILTAEQIARVCHEANRAYCMATGDHTLPTWDMAPAWQRESAIVGVEAAQANPDLTPGENHAQWMALKEKQGWKYGPTKKPEVKMHPCMVPYDELPVEQQAKDVLFLAVARALEGYMQAKPAPAPKAEPKGKGKKSKSKPNRLLAGDGMPAGSED